jgi:hypothetical protein
MLFDPDCELPILVEAEEFLEFVSESVGILTQLHISTKLAIIMIFIFFIKK